MCCAYNRHPDHPCVSVDGEGAVADAVTRLVLLGHRRIAMVSGTLAASRPSAAALPRLPARAWPKPGCAAPALIEVSFVETAVDALSSQLQARNRPTALICSNDLLAIRSIRAAHLSGLSVPGDLSVVGFDGIALGEDLTPALAPSPNPTATSAATA